MNIKNFRKGISLLIIAVLSLTLLLSGCKSEPGSWLPDVEAEDIGKITLDSYRGPITFTKDYKKEIMLEYLGGFPHENRKRTEPPEEAGRLTIEPREGEAFELAFDTYAIYADGYAYTSSEPYFSQLYLWSSGEGDGFEELSIEPRRFSEALEPLAAETVQLRLDILGGEKIEKEDGEVFDAVIELLGDLTFYYRVPMQDSPGITGYDLTDIWFVSADGESTYIGFSDTAIFYDEVFYFAPSFDEVKTSLRECLREHDFE